MAVAVPVGMRLAALASAVLAALAGACTSTTEEVDAAPLVPERDAGPPPVDAPPTGAPNGADAPMPPVGKVCDGTSVTLGSGVREFEAVVDGNTVFLYKGPQGGYMIYLSVRAVGFDPSDDTLCYTETFTASGTPLGSGCWKIRLTNDLGGGLYERVGVWGQVDPSYWTRPLAIRDHDVTVKATLTDAQGCQGQAGWRVHVSPDPGM